MRICILVLVSYFFVSITASRRAFYDDGTPSSEESYFQEEPQNESYNNVPRPSPKAPKDKNQPETQDHYLKPEENVTQLEKLDTQLETTVTSVPQIIANLPLTEEHSDSNEDIVGIFSLEEVKVKPGNKLKVVFRPRPTPKSVSSLASSNSSRNHKKLTKTEDKKAKNSKESQQVPQDRGPQILFSIQSGQTQDEEGQEELKSIQIINKKGTSVKTRTDVKLHPVTTLDESEYDDEDLITTDQDPFEVRVRQKQLKASVSGKPERNQPNSSRYHPFTTVRSTRRTTKIPSIEADNKPPTSQSWRNHYDNAESDEQNGENYYEPDIGTSSRPLSNSSSRVNHNSAEIAVAYKIILHQIRSL